MAGQVEWRRPGRVFAERVREVREPRMTQGELARRLDAAGYPMGQATIAKLETGERKNVTVDDVLAISWVLSVAPVHMLVPLRGDDPVEITPTLGLDPPTARRWIRGNPMISWMVGDTRAYSVEVPDEDFTLVQKRGIRIDQYLRHIDDMREAEGGDEERILRALDRLLAAVQHDRDELAAQQEEGS